MDLNKRITDLTFSGLRDMGHRVLMDLDNPIYQLESKLDYIIEFKYEDNLPTVVSVYVGQRHVYNEQKLLVNINVNFKECEEAFHDLYCSEIAKLVSISISNVELKVLYEYNV